VIQRHGWNLLRINGSHHIYGKAGEVARLSVPMHGAKALKTGLQRSLMRSSGLTDADLD
jgi:predicted RNA binding protein YcfA (HicA-like mRNA interferase family)